MAGDLGGLETMRSPWARRRSIAKAMAERGTLYRWPRHRAFGDSRPRPVLVIAPDAATRHGRRWVVLPLSSEPGLSANTIDDRLGPTQLTAIAALVIQALDLTCLEPWQQS